MTTYRAFFAEHLPPATLRKLDNIVTSVVTDDNLFTDRSQFGYSNSVKFDIIKRHLEVEDVDLLTLSVNYPNARTTLLESRGKHPGSLQLVAYVADLRSQIIRRLRNDAESEIDSSVTAVLGMLENLETRAMLSMRTLLLSFGSATVSQNQHPTRLS